MRCYTRPCTHLCLRWVITRFQCHSPLSHRLDWQLTEGSGRFSDWTLRNPPVDRRTVCAFHHDVAELVDNADARGQTRKAKHRLPPVRVQWNRWLFRPSSTSTVLGGTRCNEFTRNMKQWVQLAATTGTQIESIDKRDCRISN